MVSSYTHPRHVLDIANGAQDQRQLAVLAAQLHISGQGMLVWEFEGHICYNHMKINKWCAAGSQGATE